MIAAKVAKKQIFMVYNNVKQGVILCRFKGKIHQRGCFCFKRYSLGDIPMHALKHFEKYLESEKPQDKAMSLMVFVVV